MNILRARPTILMLFPAAVAAIFTMAPGWVDAAEGPQKGGFIDLGFGQYRDQTDTITTTSEHKITRIYGGYQFTDYFGAEIGYVDFATANYDTSGTPLRYEAPGYHAKAIISLPFSRSPQGYSAFFISGGAWRWDIEANEPTAKARVHGIDPGEPYGADSSQYRNQAIYQDVMLATLIQEWMVRDYNILVTGDHGINNDKLHGGTTPEVREVPLYLIRAGVQGKGNTGEVLSMLQIAPTICRLLGIPVPETMKASSLV